MTYRELRAPLFRLATAVVFVAAIGFLWTQPVQADPHFGDCDTLDIEYGCDEPHPQGPFCWDQWDCVDFDQVWHLCYCMGPYDCHWWPNGCQP